LTLTPATTGRALNILTNSKMCHWERIQILRAVFCQITYRSVYLAALRSPNRTSSHLT
jgi:hypothetical protein